MSRKTLLIIGGVLLLVCCGIIVVIAAITGVAGLTAIGLTQPAVTAGDSFMTAVKDGEYAKAYGLCTDDLKDELGSARGLETLIESNNVRPTKWNFTSRNIENDQAELEGDATFTGNREGTVSLVLFKVRDDWKIAGFNLRER